MCNVTEIYRSEGHKSAHVGGIRLDTTALSEITFRAFQTSVINQLPIMVQHIPHLVAGPDQVTTVWQVQILAAKHIQFHFLVTTALRERNCYSTLPINKTPETQRVIKAFCSKWCNLDSSSVICSQILLF